MHAASSSNAQPGYRLTRRPDGILELVIGKMLSTADVDALFDVMRPIYQAARGPDGLVRTLILMEALQTPVAAMHVRAHAAKLTEPGDRRAYVVATFLAKLQMKRVSNGGAHGVFTDRTSAEAWLKAD